MRVNPTAALDPASGDVLVTWVEQNALQSQRGISAQRISASGSRLWTDSGVPVGASGAGFPKVFSVATSPGRQGAGAFPVWDEEPSFGAGQLVGARLDATGTVRVPRFDVPTTSSGKARHTGAAGILEGVLLAWSDQGTDGGNIYVQQFDFDATPGDAGVISTPTCAGVANSTGAASQTIVAGDPDHAMNRVSLYALGGSIGRLVGPGQVQNSGESSSYHLQLDLTRQPTPQGLVAVMAGEQWYFSRRGTATAARPAPRRTSAAHRVRRSSRSRRTGPATAWLRRARSKSNSGRDQLNVIS